MILGLAGYALSLGRIDITALLLLGFHCLLRTAELLGVAWSHVALGSNFTGALALPWTKVGQQRGAQEAITIDQPMVGYWLHQAALIVGPTAPVLQTSSHEFRSFLAKGLTTLGLDGLGFKPYSLRRGGASYEFLANHDVPRIVLRGRWSDIRTARIYVTDAAAQIAALRLSPASLQSIGQYEAYLLRHFR